MKSNEEIANYYDGISKGYSELYHDEQRKKISLIKNWLPTSGSLLDAGSGAGIIHEFINSSISITAIDISKELLKLNPIKNKIEGNIESIPFENNSYDTITSFTVIQDVSNKKQAIKELNRVLKPKGKLIISFLKISSSKETILEELKSQFKIIEKREEEKDIICLCEKA